MASFPKCRSCKESHASPTGAKCAYRLTKLGLEDSEHSKKKKSTQTPEKSPSGEKFDKIIKLLEDTRSRLATVEEEQRTGKCDRSRSNSVPSHGEVHSGDKSLKRTKRQWHFHTKQSSTEDGELSSSSDSREDHGFP